MGVELVVGDKLDQKSDASEANSVVEKGRRSSGRMSSGRRSSAVQPEPASPSLWHVDIFLTVFIV